MAVIVFTSLVKFPDIGSAARVMRYGRLVRYTIRGMQRLVRRCLRGFVIPYSVKLLDRLDILPVLL